jgi:hypothetical protein
MRTCKSRELQLSTANNRPTESHALSREHHANNQQKQITKTTKIGLPVTIRCHIINHLYIDISTAYEIEVNSTRAEMPMTPSAPEQHTITRKC